MGDKLAILVAELRAIEIWDRRETPSLDTAIEARRLRRVEILGEIGALLCTVSRDMFFRT